MAIALALRALGVGSGDKVLVPTFHCPTMIAPIVDLGATPLFYPIDSEGAPNLAYLSRMQLGGVKALLAAHYFGFPRAMSDMRAFCDDHNFAFIEDCAHAMFGEAGGRGVGELGDLSIGSLPKFLPVAEGGCLVRNAWSSVQLELQPSELMANLKACIDALEISSGWGRLPGLNTGLGLLFGAKRLARRVQRSIQPEPKDAMAGESKTPSPFDFNFVPRRPPGIVNWVVAHSDLHRVVSARRRHYLDLLERLSSLCGARPLLPALEEHAVPYVFPLWVDDPEPRFRAARARGLPVFRWDWLWPSTPEIPGDEGWQRARHVFQLPCHQDLSRSDLDWMTATLHQIFAEEA